MKRRLALLSLFFCLSASAAEFEVGPWRLGMSREEVQSFQEYGPYQIVVVTGGLETHNAVLDGRQKNVSFVFDDDGLAYIQVWEYEGSDYESAKTAVLEVFEFFLDRYGGAEIPGIEVSGAAGLDRRVMEVVLCRVLGPAREIGRKTAEEQSAAMILLFDMKPKEQPEQSRVHSQFGYHARFDTFYVMVFQDRHEAPKRRVPSNVRLEAL
jgi:hypothetical protein